MTSVPQIDLVVKMAREGARVDEIGRATGLLDTEVRQILARERERNTGPAAPPSVRRAEKRTGPPPAPTASFSSPPVPTLNITPKEPTDPIDRLLEQADASDIPKVRTAAKRVRAAIGKLRTVMADTEAARREKAAAKAKAEREAAALAEKERAARAAVDTLTRELEKARADLEAVTGKPATAARKKRNLSPETRERMRQNGIRLQAEMRAKREAAAAGS